MLKNNFIQESNYPNWISNLVLVRKPNGKHRTCINFGDLNKACPKDRFSLSHIDQSVNTIIGHELLSFIDAYPGYNQILMPHANEEHTLFLIDKGIYCYEVMPFSLKNCCLK